MQLDPIGRLADPNEIDLEPITVPIIGYTLDREEVETLIDFVPSVPLSAALALNRQTRPNGNVLHPAIIEWLDACVSAESHDRWLEMLGSKDIMIETETLVEVYRQLAERYAARPTLRFSDSDGGPSSTNRTSQAAARSRASRSRKSRSPSRSTSSTP